MKTRVLASFVAALWAGGALGQVSPPAVIELVAHEGDPAPGMPGVTLLSVIHPVMDAAGNVLFRGTLGGPGIDTSNDTALFYGPPGAVQPLIWKGEPAPDMPEGFVIAELPITAENVSEGADAEPAWIAFTAGVAGPGIVPGVNSRVLFVGPPGDFRKVLQAGDQAPNCEPGVTIAEAPFGGRLSDNGTLYVSADLVGSGVPYDKARWIGTRDNLELVYRKGMQAPGCDPGVVFASVDTIRHNDAGQIAFRGLLAGIGVTSGNNTGRWLGGPGTLTKISRDGDQVPDMDEGVTWKIAAGIVTTTNTPPGLAWGDIAESGDVQGKGVTGDNDCVLFLGDYDGGLQLIAREGDPAPEAGPDVTFAGFAYCWINNQAEAFYLVKYAGPGITDSNKWATYFGPYGAGELTQRDGDPAPTFPPEVTLWRIAAAGGLAAMNDVGDVITPTQIAGPGVTDDDKVVLWLRHRVLQRWVPLLRSGSIIGGRTVYAPDEYDFGFGYCNQTSGADGVRQGMNDLGMLAMVLEFTDGTEGVFRISPPVFGDANCDGTLDGLDIAPFVLLLLDRAAYEAQYPGCHGDVSCDLDGNAAIDSGDIEMFVALLGA